MFARLESSCTSPSWQASRSVRPWKSSSTKARGVWSTRLRSHARRMRSFRLSISRRSIDAMSMRPPAAVYAVQGDIRHHGPGGPRRRLSC